MLEEMADLTVRPILRELAKDGHPFVGVLYAGLMMTADGPKVLNTTCALATGMSAPAHAP